MNQDPIYDQFRYIKYLKSYQIEIEDSLTAASLSITGNALIGGTLGVTGLATLTGGFTAGAAGSMAGFNLTGTGSLGVTGTRWSALFADDATFTDDVTIGDTLGVTGVATFTTHTIHNGNIYRNIMAPATPKMGYFYHTEHNGIVIDRSASTLYSGFQFHTAGTENWFVGQKGGAANVVIRYNSATDVATFATDSSSSFAGSVTSVGTITTSNGNYYSSVAAAGSNTALTFKSNNVMTGTMQLAAFLNGSTSVVQIKPDGSIASTGGITATTGAFSGDFAVATSKFTVASATGNTVVAGTLGVTSTFAVATNKFTADASGNIVAVGTSILKGDVSIGAGPYTFTVAAATGNTLISGTLGITGSLAIATTKFTADAATGNGHFDGTLSATGKATFGSGQYDGSVLFTNLGSISGLYDLAMTGAFSGAASITGAIIDATTEYRRSGTKGGILVTRITGDTWDVTQASLTCNSGWVVNGLDLSAIVPSGATAVFLSIETLDDTATKQCYIRGNATTAAKAYPFSGNVANKYWNWYVMIPLDTVANDRKLDWWGATGIDGVSIHVDGWTL